MELQECIDKNKNIISQYDSILQNLKNEFAKYHCYLMDVEYRKSFITNIPYELRESNYLYSKHHYEDEDMKCQFYYVKDNKIERSFIINLHSNKDNNTYIDITQEYRVLDKYNDYVITHKYFNSIKEWWEFLKQQVGEEVVL